MKNVLLLIFVFRFGQIFGGGVIDVAGLFNQSEENTLNGLISEVQATTSLDVSLLTHTSMLPQIEATSTSAIEGTNRVLIRFSLDMSGANIILSSDLEASAIDTMVNNILLSITRPLFEENRFCESGIMTLKAMSSLAFGIEEVLYVESIPIRNVDGPQWRKESTSEPVAYSRSATIKIFPKVSTTLVEEGATVQLIGRQGDQQSSKVCNIINGVVDTGGEPFEFQSNIDHVAIIDEYEIEWSIVFNSEEIELGVTTNKLFLTLGNPYNGQAIHRKILQYACGVGQNSNSEGSLINLLWGPFSSKNMSLSLFEENYSNEVLTYYNNIEPGNESISIVTDENSNRDGECGAFVQLFEEILRVHGIPTERNYLEPVRPNELMLVKEWSFSESPTFPQESEYKYVNEISGIIEYLTIDGADIRREDHQYEFIGSTDVDDIYGVEGQGVENPYSDFGNHFNVQLNNSVYDPSYGLIYQDPRAWEEESIDGYFFVNPVADDQGNLRYFMYIRKNDQNEVDISVE